MYELFHAFGLRVYRCFQPLWDLATSQANHVHG
jgi:hypothetical protein